MRYLRNPLWAGAAVLSVLLVTAAVMRAGDESPNPAAGTAADAPASLPSTVSVKLYNAQGRLVGPVEVPAVHLPETEWQKRLSKEQCFVLRGEGTERPGTGELLHNKQEGVYACAACRLPLFVSDTKFESGTGWPSFFQPVYKGNVREVPDYSHGMKRVEVECARCGGHLGHVFNDGPPPTGLRYCMNSLSLTFVKKDDLHSLADPAAVRAGTPATQPAP